MRRSIAKLMVLYAVSIAGPASFAQSGLPISDGQSSITLLAGISQADHVSGSLGALGANFNKSIGITLWLGRSKSEELDLQGQVLGGVIAVNPIIATDSSRLAVSILAGYSTIEFRGKALSILKLKLTGSNYLIGVRVGAVLRESPGLRIAPNVSLAVGNTFMQAESHAGVAEGSQEGLILALGLPLIFGRESGIVVSPCITVAGNLTSIGIGLGYRWGLR